MNQAYMKEKPVFPLLTSMALPMMLSMLVGSLYNIIDSYFVAKISEASMTALSLVFPVQNLINAVSVGFAIGINSAVAFYLGAGKQGNADTAATVGILLSGVHGFLLTAAGLWLMPGFLRLFTADEAILEMGLQYSNIVLLFTLPNVIAISFEKIFQAVGKMTVSMVSMMCGCVTNIILDPFLIFGIGFFPALGIKGAAIATVLSQLASCLFVLRFLFGPIPPLRITFGGYSLRTMLRILLTGLTPFVIIAVDNMMIIALNAVLQRYGGPEQGDLLVAAATVAQSFMLVVTMPLDGIAAGTASILGYNLGAGQPKRILEAQKYTLLLSLAYTTTLCLMGLLLAAPFTHIFTPDPQISALAVTVIRIFSIGVIPLAVQYTIVEGLNGMGMMQFSLPLSFFRKAVYFAALFTLPATFGAASTFWAEPISDLIPPLVTALFYWRKLGWIQEQALSHRTAQDSSNVSITH